MDAPLSLSNVLTVIVAVTCLSTISAQSSGQVIKLWRLAVPSSLAAVEALVLLAGVFDATFAHDAEWMAAVAIGSIIGRARGWTLPIAVDQTQDLVRLRRSVDAQAAAIGLVLLSFIDFTSAALGDPIVAPSYVATAAAFLAGYVSCRSLAIAVRAMRAPHVELLHSQRANTTSPI